MGDYIGSWGGGTIKGCALNLVQGPCVAGQLGEMLFPTVLYYRSLYTVLRLSSFQRPPRFGSKSLLAWRDPGVFVESGLG